MGIGRKGEIKHQPSDARLNQRYPNLEHDTNWFPLVGKKRAILSNLTGLELEFTVIAKDGESLIIEVRKHE